MSGSTARGGHVVLGGDRKKYLAALVAPEADEKPPSADDVAAALAASQATQLTATQPAQPNIVFILGALCRESGGAALTPGGARGRLAPQKPHD